MTRRHGDPYAGIPGRRIFVAVPLPAPAREAIETLVATVRSGADPGEREVRWVRLDGVHVTLRFIGPTLDDRIPRATAAIRVAAEAEGRFEAGLDGAGAFPDAVRPRALWLGIGQGASDLSRLTAAVDRELAARGWPPDERPFRPHLTLARSDGVGTGARTAARLVQAASELDVRWTVDRLVLYESVTGGGPARYVPLAEAPLEGDRGPG
jgi:RNA 2',3'-cyclic 3'-phosphodiesterase